MESFCLGRSLSFAHRGASHQAPANTLAAFRRAVELGADGIELDAHLSRDGQVVIIHDFCLDATTDGQGPVRNRTLAELKRLDAGCWFAPEFAGERIPTLEEVIDAVGQRVLLNIELKTARVRDDGLPGAVVRIIERSGMGDRVVISSFSPLAVWRVRRLDPDLPIGLLYGPTLRQLHRPLLRSWLRPQALHPLHTIVDGRYVRWARQHGYRIHTWTVDDLAEMQRLVRLGVEIIITNRPELLRQVLATGGG